MNTTNIVSLLELFHEYRNVAFLHTISKIPRNCSEKSTLESDHHIVVTCCNAKMVAGIAHKITILTAARHLDNHQRQQSTNQPTSWCKFLYSFHLLSSVYRTRWPACCIERIEKEVELRMQEAKDDNSIHHISNASIHGMHRCKTDMNGDDYAGSL